MGGVEREGLGSTHHAHQVLHAVKVHATGGRLLTLTLLLLQTLTLLLSLLLSVTVIPFTALATLAVTLILIFSLRGFIRALLV